MHVSRHQLRPRYGDVGRRRQGGLAKTYEGCCLASHRACAPLPSWGSGTRVNDKQVELASADVSSSPGNLYGTWRKKIQEHTQNTEKCQIHAQRQIISKTKASVTWFAVWGSDRLGLYPSSYLASCGPWVRYFLSLNQFPHL